MKMIQAILLISALSIGTQGCMTLAALATAEGVYCVVKLVKSVHGVYSYIKDCNDKEKEDES